MLGTPRAGASDAAGGGQEAQAIATPLATFRLQASVKARVTLNLTVALVLSLPPPLPLTLTRTRDTRPSSTRCPSYP